MKIVSLDLFDLFGDGTLVMKTNVDEPDSAFRYAWYIKENGRATISATPMRPSSSSAWAPIP